MRYIIPENFAPEGTVLNRIKIVNLIQTIIMDAALGAIIIFLIPLSLRNMITLMILVLAPTTIIGLMGINGRSVFKYFLDVITTARNKTIYEEPDPSEAIRREKRLQQEKHKRERAMAKAQKREKRQEKKDLAKEKKSENRYRKTKRGNK